MGRSNRSQRCNTSFYMPELTGQTFTPRLIFAPSGPISIGAGLPRSAMEEGKPGVPGVKNC